MSATITKHLNQAVDVFPSLLHTAKEQSVRFLRNHWPVLLIACLAQIAVYTYFYTTVTFTNHTFPNVWLYAYPSFKTQSEGRWLADLLIQAGGGAGTQSFQMAMATVLQAVNGILLARWLYLRRQSDILLVTLLLCFFPTFLDYYVFACDHISFVLGDTLCITAVIWLRRRTWTSILGAAACYAGALAIYATKIALISFLAFASLILGITEAHHSIAKPNRSVLARELVFALLPLLIGLTVFGVTLKWLVVSAGGVRTSLNDISEASAAFAHSYRNTARFFSGAMGGLPSQIRFLPLLVLLAGGARGLMLAARSLALPGTVMSAFAILATPPAICATWILNQEAWQSGRIYPAHAYFFLFFLAFLLRWPRARRLAWIGSVVLCWLLINLGSQQVNAIEFKSLYEQAFVQRIISRVEPLLPSVNPERQQTPLVVIGEIPPFASSKYIRYPMREATPHALNSSAFADYRQTEIVNFFLGNERVRRPTHLEQSAIVSQSLSRAAWPATESTFNVDHTIGVILQTYKPRASITWQQHQ